MGQALKSVDALLAVTAIYVGVHFGMDHAKVVDWKWNAPKPRPATSAMDHLHDLIQEAKCSATWGPNAVREIQTVVAQRLLTDVTVQTELQSILAGYEPLDPSKPTPELLAELRERESRLWLMLLAMVITERMELLRPLARRVASIQTRIANAQRTFRTPIPESPWTESRLRPGATR
jgi:hypothetical protein